MHRVSSGRAFSFAWQMWPLSSRVLKRSDYTQVLIPNLLSEQNLGTGHPKYRSVRL